MTSDEYRAEYARRMAKAQTQMHYTIAGTDYPRVRYGGESDDWGASHQDCGDCGVKPGEFHVLGCDIERCPKCGGQAISCSCDDEEDDDDE